MFFSPEKNCDIYKETDRAELFDCDGKITGKDKTIKRSTKQGIFSLRNEVNSKSMKNALNDIGGLKKFVNSGDNVYLKLNFSPIAQSPNSKIIETIVKEAKKIGAEVSIIDNDDAFRPFTNELLTNAGYYETIKKYRIPVYNLKGSDKVEFNVRGTKFNLPKFLFEPDAKLISVATMKHDLISGVNLGQKNLLGLIDKSDLEGNNTEEMISNITKVVNPKLTILDGSGACLSGYPLGCKDDDGKFLIVSDDPVCADSWGSKLLWYSVDKVGHIKISEDIGLGSQNCIEAKKSKNPILVANSKWKKLAPSPKMVEEFSNAYETVRDTIGVLKSNSLWSETIVPIFNDLKKKI